MKINVAPSELMNIDKLFSDKNWLIEADKPIRISLYNRFIDRYSRIDKHTREFFLELAQRFTTINASDVYDMFKDAYDTIPNDYLSNFERIFIYPLVEPYLTIVDGQERVARPKVKSGEKLKMQIEFNDYHEIPFSDKIVIPDDFRQITNEFNGDKHLLIFIDDFIGTGGTALTILKQLFENDQFSASNTIIVSLVAQERGLENVKNEINVDCFFKQIEQRGLSDFFIDQELDQKKILVGDMEKAIKVPLDYHLGYEESEALISIMNKSPNNTLPIFWYETKSTIAPFQREKKFKLR